MGKNQDQDPGCMILETIFLLKIFKFFDADADPGIFLTLKFGIWNLENLDPGYCSKQNQ
jgi:hypothetical protein